MPVQCAVYVLYCIYTTARAGYHVYKSHTACVHYCQRSVLGKSCFVHALLPVQCATWVLFFVCVCTTASAVCGVNPVLCMHYCQHSVLHKCCFLCVHYCQCSVLCKSCSVFALLPAQYAVAEYCQRSMPCGGYDKSSFFQYFLLFLPIPTSWEWMSTGSPIITTSKSCLSCYAP